jgi:hypothetical protein
MNDLRSTMTSIVSKHQSKSMAENMKQGFLEHTVVLHIK